MNIYELIDSIDFEGMANEAYWMREDYSTIFKQQVEELAIAKGITIPDAWDYETQWETVYNSAEKGLS